MAFAPASPLNRIADILKGNAPGNPKAEETHVPRPIFLRRGTGQPATRVGLHSPGARDRPQERTRGAHSDPADARPRWSRPAVRSRAREPRPARDFPSSRRGP